MMGVGSAVTVDVVVLVGASVDLEVPVTGLCVREGREVVGLTAWSHSLAVAG